MMDGATQMLGVESKPSVVRDECGRELCLRKLTALDRLRLFKALGPALSQNTAYLGMAMLAMSVTAIDGIPIPAPATEAQIEGVVAKLGDAGGAAVAGALAHDAVSEMDGISAGN